MSNFPDKRDETVTGLRAKTKFPLTVKAEAAIEAFGGMPAVCGLILDGLTLGEVAARIGVQRSQLSAWHLNLADPAFAASMRASAERCLERAEEALDLKPEDRTMPCVQLARERAAIWRHRASVRDAAYSPKGISLDLSTAAPAAAPPSFTIMVAVNRPHEEVVIDGEPGNVDMHDPDQI